MPNDMAFGVTLGLYLGVVLSGLVAVVYSLVFPPYPDYA